MLPWEKCKCSVEVKYLSVYALIITLGLKSDACNNIQ